MKKAILQIVLIFASSLFMFFASVHTKNNIACAALFKPANLASCTDGTGTHIPDFNSCPNPEGDNLPYCVRSTDIYLNVYMLNISPSDPTLENVLPPENSTISITVTAEPRICEYVQCLLREETVTVTVTPEILQQLATTGAFAGKATKSVKIGCTGGACGPSQTIQAKLTITTPPDSNITCRNSEISNYVPISNAPVNDSLSLPLTCTKPFEAPSATPAPPTPTTFCPAPGIVPNVKVTCPNCSQ